MLVQRQTKERCIAIDNDQDEARSEGRINSNTFQGAEVSLQSLSTDRRRNLTRTTAAKSEHWVEIPRPKKGLLCCSVVVSQLPSSERHKLGSCLVHQKSSFKCPSQHTYRQDRTSRKFYPYLFCHESRWDPYSKYASNAAGDSRSDQRHDTRISPTNHVLNNSSQQPISRRRDLVDSCMDKKECAGQGSKQQEGNNNIILKGKAAVGCTNMQQQ